MANPREYCMYDDLARYKASYIIEEYNENLMDISGKCMDVGCGPGDITKDILLPSLGSNAQLIGTDISENMIKYANETFSDKERLQFDVLDIRTKNLPEKYISEFQHIFSFHALQWCNDIRQALKNIYQMLRPNGTILMHVIAYSNIFEVLKIVEQDTRFAQYIPEIIKDISPYQESKSARKELKELLQNTGFTVHHCSLREMTYSEIKSDRFLKMVMSTFTFLDDMPQDVRKEFKDILTYEYLRRKIRYKSIYYNQEHTLHMSKGLVVYAQKIV